MNTFVSVFQQVTRKGRNFKINKKMFTHSEKHNEPKPM